MEAALAITHAHVFIFDDFMRFRKPHGRSKGEIVPNCILGPGSLMVCLSLRGRMLYAFKPAGSVVMAMPPPREQILDMLFVVTWAETVGTEFEDISVSTTRVLEESASSANRRARREFGWKGK